MGSKLDQWVADSAAHDGMVAAMNLATDIEVDLLEGSSTETLVRVRLRDDQGEALEPGSRFGQALQTALDSMMPQVFTAVTNTSQSMLDGIKDEARAEAQAVLDATE